jgi:hypothetical protein
MITIQYRNHKIISYNNLSLSYYLLSITEQPSFFVQSSGIMRKLLLINKALMEHSTQHLLVTCLSSHLQFMHDIRPYCLMPVVPNAPYVWTTKSSLRLIRRRSKTDMKQNIKDKYYKVQKSTWLCMTKFVHFIPMP